MASQQFQQLLQMIRARPVPETRPTIADMRAGYEQMSAMFPLPADVQREPTTAGGVPAEWVMAPGAAADRAVLYLHGGGYVIGSITTHRDLAARLSRAAAARVLVLGYRLAPEHPYPAALEDAVAAYRQLLDEGLAPERTVIAGDSAGGGLAVATLVALRDAGAPLPAAGVCISPWTDLALTGESLVSRAAADPIVNRPLLEMMVAAYLGTADPRTPGASPLYADLTGLPPLLIQVGTAEAIYDDAARLAERARAAGVDVTFEPWEEMIHVWHGFAAMLPEGQQAIARIGAYVQEHTM
jgi:monoterpene epsilon-lactone hydrolase